MSDKRPNNHKDGYPRIAIISSERYPHHDTNTQQIIKNATALHAAGISVELIIPAQLKTYFSKKTDLADSIYKYYNVAPGLPIRVLRGIPASNLRLEKFFHSLTATLLVLFDKQVDLIYTRNKFAALLAFLFGKKFMFETYRLLGDENPKIMRWLAKKSVSGKFAGMVLHSKLAAASMQRAGFPKEKLLVLHNGYDNADMLPLLSKEAARKELKLATSAKYVVYTGNMQKNKSIECLVDLAAMLPDAIFLLVGGTPEDVERLGGYAASLSVENVVLTGRQPISQVSKYLYAADVLIIPPASAPLEKYGKTVLPFKLFPYLAAARPIVAPDQPDMRELLSHNENALLVEPDNPVQNARLIAQLLDDVQLQQRLSDNASVTSTHLTWKKRAEKFKNWLANGQYVEKREVRIAAR